MIAGNGSITYGQAFHLIDEAVKAEDLARAHGLHGSSPAGLYDVAGLLEKARRDGKEDEPLPEDLSRAVHDWSSNAAIWADEIRTREARVSAVKAREGSEQSSTAVPQPATGPRIIGWRKYQALELPPIEWALRFGEHGFLRTSGDVAIAGTPGAFKTTITVSACADLANLGHRVGLVELEGDENDLRSEIRRAIGERDVPNEAFLTARYDGCFSLLSKAYRADLTQNFEGKVDVLVFDSVPKMTAGVDENSPDFAGAVALGLELKRDIGARLLLMLCHTVKTEWRAGEEPCLADIRGHGSLAGVLDAAFILRPAKDARERVQEGTAHVELWPVKQRGAALGPALDLAYTRKGNALERSFSVIDRAARKKGGRTPEQSDPELDAEVLSFVRRKGPCSKRQVRNNVGGGDARKDSALLRLLKAQQLDTDSRGRYFAPGFVPAGGT